MERVFQQRLDEHRWHEHPRREPVGVDPADEVVVKPALLHRQILFQGIQLPGERLERARFPEGEAQIFGEILRHLLHRSRIVFARRHGVEGIEEEVRIHLLLQLPQLVLPGQRLRLNSPVFRSGRGRRRLKELHLRHVDIVEEVDPQIDRAPHQRRHQPRGEGRKRHPGLLDHRPFAQQQQGGHKGHRHPQNRHDHKQRPALRTGQGPQGRQSKQHVDEARDRKAAHDPQPDRPPRKRLAGPQRHRKPAERCADRQPKKHLKHPHNLLPPPARAPPQSPIGGRGIELIGASR